MRILKSHPLLKMVNSYVVDSPQPSNISYLWNFGSLLAFCLIIQIVTGVTLGMHYTPNALEAFDSVEHIMRDVNNGWLIRYLHSNTASAFFFLVYLHIGRGLYYASYKSPRTLTWVLGTIIFILMMATAFLGYHYSPKWYELIFNLLLFFIYVIFLFSPLFSFILLYLDNFNLSNIRVIKYIQMFSFIVIPIIFFLFIYSNLNYSDVIFWIDENKNNGNNIHLHGHVSLSEQVGRVIGQSIGNLGSNVGLAGTVGAFSYAVSQGIVKSSLPPLQKAGVIIAGGIIGAGVHTTASYFNRGLVGTSRGSNVNINNDVNKFLPDSEFSPLQGILWWTEIIDYACLSVMYILIIQLVFKFYFKDNITLSLSKLLGNSLNNKIEYYINKIIKFNKQMSIFWIWFILAILIYGLGSNTYFIYGMYDKIDIFVNSHNTTDNNILPTVYTSIGDGLSNLNIANIISLSLIISLIMILYFRFHFNKNINNIYIWIIVVILIIALAYSGYISGELYTNIDSYVNIYKNNMGK